jgi:hypothetical protein
MSVALSRRKVLVLNKGWNPIAIVSLERAICLIVGTYRDGEPKARVLDASQDFTGLLLVKLGSNYLNNNMKHRREEKELAIELRKQGLSVRAIRKIIPNCSQSTVHSWIRDVPLTEEQREKLQQSQCDKMAQSPNAPKQRWEKIRNDIKEAAIKQIPNGFDFELLRIVGTALYWCEGLRTQRNEISFANSDGDMIAIMMKYFRWVCAIPEEKIKGSIAIHAGNNVEESLNYWSTKTGINCNALKVRILEVKSDKPRKTMPLGCFTIRVDDTRKRAMINGWMLGLRRWSVDE